MNAVLLEILIIAVLLLGNGVFAMTEIAVVSARKGRLRSLAAAGDPRAQAALDLMESPNRFFSTVQVGITLVGVLAGAFGGATLAKAVGDALDGVPWLAPYSEFMGIGLVVVAITYFSLIIGELVPKRLALKNPEAIARWMARPMIQLSRLANPLVRLLSFSTEVVLRVLRVRQAEAATVSEEEIKGLLQEGVKAGVFDKAEPRMVESVLALDRLPVREIMTPRSRIMFLRKDDAHDDVWHKIVVSGHSEFPLRDTDRDHIIGIVSVKAIYAHLAAGIPVRLVDLAEPPLIVPSVQPVLRLVETFRHSRKTVALVADEFGAIVGLATMLDVLEAITGEIPSCEERNKPRARYREDGSWLVDGLMELEALERKVPGLRLPRSTSANYQTVAGFLLAQFSRVPAEGEALDSSGYRFEVIDMDRLRIDKVLITPQKP